MSATDEPLTPEEHAAIIARICDDSKAAWAAIPEELQPHVTCEQPEGPLSLGEVVTILVGRLAEATDQLKELKELKELKAATDAATMASTPGDLLSYRRSPDDLTDVFYLAQKYGWEGVKSGTRLRTFFADLLEHLQTRIDAASYQAPREGPPLQSGNDSPEAAKPSAESPNISAKDIFPHPAPWWFSEDFLGMLETQAREAPRGRADISAKTLQALLDLVRYFQDDREKRENPIETVQTPAASEAE